MGVMTMKMISNTSITSTMGVTLILELTLLPSLRTAIAIVWAPLPLKFVCPGWLPALSCEFSGKRTGLKPAGRREHSLSHPPQIPALADWRFA
jgi:hypothetical protein